MGWPHPALDCRTAIFEAGMTHAGTAGIAAAGLSGTTGMAPAVGPPCKAKATHIAIGQATQHAMAMGASTRRWCVV